MNYLYAFVFGGILSLIAQIIIDNTKLTPGHITSFYAVLGAILGAFGIYEVILELTPTGGVVPITAFGNNLYQAAYEGLTSSGILGLFKNILVKSSLGLSATIIFSFFFILLNDVKD